MKSRRYPYSGSKRESTFETINLMINDNSSVESVRNNGLVRIYSLEGSKHE